MDLFNQIRKKLVIFVHFKGFNISQKTKSSPLSYFAQKTSLNLAPNWYPIIFTCPFRSDSCSYISNIDISIHSEIANLILSMSLNFIKAWRNDKWYNKRVLIWRFSFNQDKFWTNWRSNRALLYNKLSILYQWK